MIELKTFQSDAARLIAERYELFNKYRPLKANGRPRPFFQALAALTGAGKTPILAQSVNWLRISYPSIEPIVLWMSKAKSVVGQTLTNFSAGGKYHEILEGFRIAGIQDMEPTMLADGSVPLILMTTTGVFNNKDQVAGHLRIYKSGQDLFGGTSPWERLKDRLMDDGRRRPLIIVYDEGHNLSEQQTDILAELDADAYLLASSTLKLPEGFEKSVVKPILGWVEEVEDMTGLAKAQALGKNGKADPRLFITTAVSSDAVVDAQLVKRAIQFDGTTAPMERCLDELTDRMTLLRSESKRLGLSIQPKAIYVCKTNINDDGSKDDPKAPFQMRQAPPIRIWQYLVEQKKVSPKDIAIYANLDFAEGSKPEEVNLFSKGESDFDDFSAGEYKHIIFNLALQEGWDDPGCYCAYIDKSMGSSIAVEQMIGRVLRQYGAEHYESPLLNSAHFFIRVDKENVFDETISKIQRKLNDEGAPIEITSNFGGTGAGSITLEPRFDDVTLYEVHVNSVDAQPHVAEELAKYPSYSKDDPSTKGEARTAKTEIDMTKLGDSSKAAWSPGGDTNPVRVRWLLTNAIRERSSRVSAMVDTTDSKFDVRVQMNSPAASMVGDVAERVVEAYFDHSELSYETSSPMDFGPLRTAKDASTFTCSLYERYGGLNKMEMKFAEALDRAKVRWHRNPNAGGYSIPLLTPGDTGSFRPDFLVWSGKKVFCLDTKGKHLLSDAVARKLFDIQDPDTGKVALHVRLISEGKQTSLGSKASGGGYTVWKMKSGSVHPVHVESMDKAVAACLK
ncbi:hypothetical protein EAH75_08345 [Rhodanobacter glycinis]|uniref:hypothetical protein n=1 Tax=Rhodanobacter glycinis TaxID=582702 RepID=UPI00112D2DC8|nr:hypothetical protein [Rhodanobacter glycinis]TPG48462.1 hypothetical protein EAH75_08345 [Rhodanobacter glycinis]